MTRMMERIEPSISFGMPVAPPMRNISREARPSLPNGLTRSVLRDQARGGRGRDGLETVRDRLGLSSDTFAAIATQLQAGTGPALGETAISGAMDALFTCEPIRETTPHPLVLVGGSHTARLRAALSLAQRLQRNDRRVALYSLQEGRFPTPMAMYVGGLDILTVGSVDACIDAVRATEPDELAIIEASCMDIGEEQEKTLSMLTLSLTAEAIYVDDGEAPVPDFARFPGVERFILSGRPTPERFGALLDAAFRGGQAFAGQAMERGIYHPMTPAMLADRFALSVH